MLVSHYGKWTKRTNHFRVAQISTHYVGRPLSHQYAHDRTVYGVPMGFVSISGQSDDDVAQLATLVVDAKSARLKYADFVI